VFQDERLDVLPDVPTFAELDIDVFPYGPVVQMAYIDAPAGIDPEVRETLTRAFENALTSERFQSFAEEAGFQIDPVTGEELEAEIESISAAIAEVAEQVFEED
jgi:tripartite-type tricarboxylate transporter receptor subunit TctC